jgi:hypothetical protein
VNREIAKKEGNIDPEAVEYATLKASYLLGEEG